MNIVIPEILAGGVGRSIQGVAGSISRMGGTASKIVSEVENNYKKLEDQQNLIEASRLENDMTLEKRKSFAGFERGDDGTNSKYVDQVREEDERIGQGYISKASNDKVKEYLTKVHFYTQKNNLLQAEKGQESRLYQTSVENMKIQTDNVIRRSAPFADFDGGMQAIDQYVNSQAGYFGANTPALSSAMKARFTENMVKLSLSDPVLSPVMLRRLADPEEKKRIFDHIPADRIDDMERMIATAGASERKRQGMNIGVAIFKADTTGSVETMADAVRAKGLDADTEMTAISQIKEMTIQREHDEARRKNATIDKYSGILAGIALKRNGLNRPSDLSTKQWEELTNAAPEFAGRLQDSMRRELDYQTRQGKESVRDRRIWQADNESAILISDDFATRDLKRDLAAGDISPAQYTKLLKAQEKLDPIKRDSVRAALSKVNSGSALGKAIGVKGNEEASWKLKYGDLVKAWAYNHADDPDFDKKMTEFVEKQVLSDMVTNWFSSDDTDRLNKFQKAKAEAGNLPQRGKKQGNETVIMNDMPSAVGNNGRIILDTVTGNRLKSNGKEWIEVK